MACPNCGETVRVQKRLRRGKSGHPDECPECGEELRKDDDTTLLRKG